MDPDHLKELIAVERSYWWHVAKRELVIGLLLRWFPPPGRLVEGGVGGGANLLEFRDLGYEVEGFDLMSASVEHCRGLGVPARVHDLGEPWPVEPRGADVVVMLDVIEHVPDPVRVLRHAAEALRPGGGLVLTVPAAPYLIGPWDRMLGHYRRYSARLLLRHVAEAGLRVDWLSHWNLFTLPPAVVTRTAEKLVGRKPSAEVPPVPLWLNRLLVNLARAERTVMRRLPLAAGLSLVGVFTHADRSGCEAVGGGRTHPLGRHSRVQRGGGAEGARKSGH
jgi:SAM-dependent methyltransferase